MRKSSNNKSFFSNDDYFGKDLLFSLKTQVKKEDRGLIKRQTYWEEQKGFESNEKATKENLSTQPNPFFIQFSQFDFNDFEIVKIPKSLTKNEFLVNKVPFCVDKRSFFFVYDFEMKEVHVEKELPLSEVAIYARRVFYSWCVRQIFGGTFLVSQEKIFSTEEYPFFENLVEKNNEFDIIEDECFFKIKFLGKRTIFTPNYEDDLISEEETKLFCCFLSEIFESVLVLSKPVAKEFRSHFVSTQEKVFFHEKNSFFDSFKFLYENLKKFQRKLDYYFTRIKYNFSYSFSVEIDKNYVEKIFKDFSIKDDGKIIFFLKVNVEKFNQTRDYPVFLDLVDACQSIDVPQEELDYIFQDFNLIYYPNSKKGKNKTYLKFKRIHFDILSNFDLKDNESILYNKKYKSWDDYCKDIYAKKRLNDGNGYIKEQPLIECTYLSSDGNIKTEFVPAQLLETVCFPSKQKINERDDFYLGNRAIGRHSQRNFGHLKDLFDPMLSTDSTELIQKVVIFINKVFFESSSNLSTHFDKKFGFDQLQILSMFKISLKVSDFRKFSYFDLHKIKDFKEIGNVLLGNYNDSNFNKNISEDVLFSIEKEGFVFKKIKNLVKLADYNKKNISFENLTLLFSEEIEKFSKIEGYDFLSGFLSIIEGNCIKHKIKCKNFNQVEKKKLKSNSPWSIQMKSLVENSNDKSPTALCIPFESNDEIYYSIMLKSFSLGIVEQFLLWKTIFSNSKNERNFDSLALNIFLQMYSKMSGFPYRVTNSIIDVVNENKDFNFLFGGVDLVNLGDTFHNFWDGFYLLSIVCVNYQSCFTRRKVFLITPDIFKSIFEVIFSLVSLSFQQFFSLFEKSENYPKNKKDFAVIFFSTENCKNINNDFKTRLILNNVLDNKVKIFNEKNQMGFSMKFFFAERNDERNEVFYNGGESKNFNECTSFFKFRDLNSRQLKIYLRNSDNFFGRNKLTEATLTLTSLGENISNQKVENFENSSLLSSYFYARVTFEMMALYYPSFCIISKPAPLMCARNLSSKFSKLCFNKSKQKDIKMNFLDHSYILEKSENKNSSISSFKEIQDTGGKFYDEKTHKIIEFLIHPRSQESFIEF